MAPTKVLNCSHGQALYFEYIANGDNSQKGVSYVNLRLLDLERKARSLKKTSFFISP